MSSWSFTLLHLSARLGRPCGPRATRALLRGARAEHSCRALLRSSWLAMLLALPAAALALPTAALALPAAALALPAAALALPAAALAQPPDPRPDDGTSMAFRPMDESEVEDVDGGALMVAAYGVIFVLLLGYVLYLARIQAGTSAELIRLRKAIEKARGYREPAGLEAEPRKPGKAED